LKCKVRTSPADAAKALDRTVDPLLDVSLPLASVLSTSGETSNSLPVVLTYPNQALPTGDSGTVLSPKMIPAAPTAAHVTPPRSTSADAAG